MTDLFADTAYLLGLLNPADELHARACEFPSEETRSIVTTAWVLTEFMDAMCQPANRPLAVSVVQQWRRDPRITIIPPTQELFDAGLDLFEQRGDKDWSLTDCISFVVMRREGLREALTADHHFAQAGFDVLLK